MLLGFGASDGLPVRVRYVVIIVYMLINTSQFMVEPDVRFNIL